MIVTVTLYCPGCGGELHLAQGILAERNGFGFPFVRHAAFVACKSCALVAEVDQQTGRLRDGRNLADLERRQEVAFTRPLGNDRRES